MQIEYFDLPSHWASALVNGDETGLEHEDERALGRFVDWMVAEYGACHCLASIEDDVGFARHHDATRFGVLACDVSTFAFDVTA